MLSKNSPWRATLRIHDLGSVGQVHNLCHLCNKAHPWEYILNHFYCLKCEGSYTLKEDADRKIVAVLEDLPERWMALPDILLVISDDPDDTQRIEARRKKQDPKLSGDPEYDQT